MNLIFAALARDCEKTIENNICKLLSLVEDPRVGTLEIFVLENDSQDNTRSKLYALSQAHPEITLFLHLPLDQKFPRRVERIAYCRQFLLDKIRTRLNSAMSLNTLYISVDLDSEIVSSVNTTAFVAVCQLLQVKKEFDALFPISKPFYYDILALRAPQWCNSDCANDLSRCQAFKSRFIYEVGRLWIVVRRQKSPSTLVSKGDFIPVDSAFGGIGIYSIRSVSQGCYFSSSWSREIFQESNEHVLFNRFISSKAICTKLVVQAPMEHLPLVDSRNLWSFSQIVLKALILDIKSVANNLLHRIALLFTI